MKKKSGILGYLPQIGAVVAVGASLTALGFGISAFMASRALTKAEEHLKKGFGALAAETLDCYRFKMVKDAPRCQVILAAYFSARMPERLEWAGQACLDNGIETPEVYSGLAAAREFTNRDNDALRILLNAAGKFDKSPDIYYRLAQIFKRNKRDENAVAAYFEASKRAPSNETLSLEAMEYFAAIERWPDAGKMAQLLKTAKTDNPEVKLLIARSLIKGVNAEEAKPIIAEARELIAKNPAAKEALEKSYADVLGTP